MKITVPDCWEELSGYQQREIIDIISRTDTEDFSEQYLRVVQVLLMKTDSTSQYIKMRKILKNIPISNFAPALEFLGEKPKLFKFPEIEGLLKPADRLGDLCIEQFSLCDTLFYRYKNAPNKSPEAEIYLRQLVATLYRKNTEFNKNLLPQIAEITDKISLKEAQRIGFVFGAIRMYIADIYPSIFRAEGSKDKENSDAPVFRKKEKFTPFSQVIVMMAADELRLLGNLNECQKTPLYDFMNAFLESKRIHQMKQKMMK